MANVKLIFNGSEISETTGYELQLYVNKQNEIFISIADHSMQNPYRFICLDKSTAIKLSKELRRQISLI